MDHPMSRPHHSLEQGEPHDREPRRVPIRHAVLLIQDEHDVCEMSAYAILVHASVDSRSSVRETAARIVEDSQLGRPPKSQ